MYFITTKRMLEVCFSAHPNIQYRTCFLYNKKSQKSGKRLFPFEMEMRFFQKMRLISV